MSVVTLNLHVKTKQGRNFEIEQINKKSFLTLQAVDIGIETIWLLIVLTKVERETICFPWPKYGPRNGHTNKLGREVRSLHGSSQNNGQPLLGM